MSYSHWRDGAYLECAPGALMSLIDEEAERLDPGHLSRVADESRINADEDDKRTTKEKDDE